MNKKDKDNLLNNYKEIIFTQCDSDDKIYKVRLCQIILYCSVAHTALQHC